MVWLDVDLASQKKKGCFNHIMTPQSREIKQGETGRSVAASGGVPQGPAAVRKVAGQGGVAASSNTPQTRTPLISAVVPCYNEQESLPLFVQELARIVTSWQVADAATGTLPRFELVLIDDGSSDNTLEVMRAVAQDTSLPFEVRYKSFSRNFGKEAALYAGLEAARGDYVATMDADMQDPPSLLPQMFEILQTEDCDNVATRRTTREGEPPIRSFFARMFYKLINKMSTADIVDGARDYRLMKRIMVDAILSLGEYNRFSKGIFGWVGFKTHWLPYVNVERVAGETHWNFWQLFVYALDGIVAFSTKPLSIASIVGVLLCFASLVAIVVIIVRTLLFGDAVGGWPSMMCAIVFLGGLQLLCLGIIGQYLSKAYLETKNRPIYIVRESNC